MQCVTILHAMANISVTKCPELPGDTKMNDPFLSTLIQMVQVEYIPTCFLLIPAHRVCLGEARETDGSKQVAINMSYLKREQL